MDIKELKPNCYQYGNKGAVWTNTVHIAKSDAMLGYTLCGTAMLSHNWAQIVEHNKIGCPVCIVKHNDLKQTK